MKNVSRILIVCMLLISSVSFAQKDSDKLRNEQKKLESQIANTKSLLQASQKNTATSLQELRLIENQVKFRERLLNNYDDQIRSAELAIREKNQGISALEDNITKLKSQYKKLLIYAYKKRNKYGQMMYIFSSSSVEEARKRKVYLDKFAEIQEKQLILIRQNKVLLAEEITTIEAEKSRKLVLVGSKREERAQILKDKVAKEEIYTKFKNEENDILAQLKIKEGEKDKLQRKIKKAIEAEIAAEQKRAEKERKAREKAAKEAKAAKANKPDPADKPAAPAPFAVTKESETLGKNFASNKGKLPWPVEKGTITENYGRNPHPTVKNIYTQNNGVDISTPKNATIRAVFEGEVTSVFSIQGAGKVVIVKHGNYRTVYSNLQDVYVSKGSKITTKAPIGSLLPNPDGTVSVAHFEIHVVTDKGIDKLNPNLWIAQ